MRIWINKIFAVEMKIRAPHFACYIWERMRLYNSNSNRRMHFTTMAGVIDMRRLDSSFIRNGHYIHFHVGYYFLIAINPCVSLQCNCSVEWMNCHAVYVLMNILSRLVERNLNAIRRKAEKKNWELLHFERSFFRVRSFRLSFFPSLHRNLN